MVGSATENDVPGDPRFYLDRQILFIVGRLGADGLATRLNLDGWRAGRGACGAACWAALAVVFVVGTAVKGSNRWIDIGPFNLQPSEIGKVAIAIVLAGIAVDRMEDVGTARFTLFLTGVAAVPAVVVFLQPDLGTSLVYVAVLRRHPVPGGRALVALRRGRLDPGHRHPGGAVGPAQRGRRRCCRTTRWSA